MENLIFSHTWKEIRQAQQLGNLSKPIKIGKGDTGADPLGGGKFKMYPSGTIVDFKERNKRLNKT